ncbi:MAG: DUF445 family protein [Myxococcota bacterium]|nr:DUF445 family protein [Myxococcota bacterium]
MPHWLYVLLAVPTVSAFIGWLTNWQAVKMIFWPAQRTLGWQGIVYAHSDKFAKNLGQIAQNELMNADEMAAKLDPDELERAVLPVLDAEAPVLIAAAAEHIRPGAWQMVPPPMQAMVIEQVKQRARAISRELGDELRPRAAKILDVEALVAGQLSGPNVERLARLTEQIGKKEFKFIEYSGAVFGLLIGFAQIAVWETMNRWWLMPIFGVIVGLITNYFAIQMIFRPHERKRYLGFIPYQGLFPKRQAEIARDYGETTAAEVITPRNIIELLITGERGQQLLAELTQLLSNRLDQEWAKVQGLIPIPVTDAQVAEIKQLVLARMMALTPKLRPEVEALLERQLDIRNTVETRLAALSKPDFERMLRGVFEEDETTLIIVGGVLGGAVGALQGALMVAGVG